MKTEDARKVDAKARERFTYRLDPSDRDTWRSHHADVEAGRAWEGDCDDLASTVLQLAGRQGCPLTDRYRLMTDLDGDGRSDHLVAAIWCDEGHFLIVGDVNGPPVVVRGDGPPVLQFNRLDEVRPDNSPIWRDGPPWSAA